MPASGGEELDRNAEAEIIIIEARCNRARDLNKTDLEILILMNNNPW